MRVAGHRHRRSGKGKAMAVAQRTRETTRSQKGRTPKALQEEPAAREVRGATVPVPVPQIHTVQVPVGEGMQQAGQFLTRRLPPPGRLAFYGALGAGAVFGVLDWPVAAAIGLGVVIVRRARDREAGQARS